MTQINIFFFVSSTCLNNNTNRQLIYGNMTRQIVRKTKGIYIVDLCFVSKKKKKRKL